MAYPYIKYGIECGGNTLSKYINTIILLQKKIIRHILGLSASPYYTQYDQYAGILYKTDVYHLILASLAHSLSSFITCLCLQRLENYLVQLCKIILLEHQTILTSSYFPVISAYFILLEHQTILISSYFLVISAYFILFEHQTILTSSYFQIISAYFMIVLS